MPRPPNIPKKPAKPKATKSVPASKAKLAIGARAKKWISSGSRSAGRFESFSAVAEALKNPGARYARALSGARIALGDMLERSSSREETPRLVLSFDSSIPPDVVDQVIKAISLIEGVPVIRKPAKPELIRFDTPFEI